MTKLFCPYVHSARLLKPDGTFSPTLRQLSSPAPRPLVLLALCIAIMKETLLFHIVPFFLSPHNCCVFSRANFSSLAFLS